MVAGYYIWTIGCQMNKADSSYIASLLEQAGYFPVTCAEAADIMVLNSCVVRQNAEDKVVAKLSSLKGLKKIHPNLRIILTGCMVDHEVEELQKRFPYIDLFFRPQDWETLQQWGGKQTGRVNILPISSPPPVSSFVTIIRGCDNFCSYCIVPYRRGREQSCPMEDILGKVEELVQRGTQEVTLLGQNVDSYGHDLPAKPQMADLLAELNSITGLRRIRFLTNHPKDMNHRLIEAVAQLDKVCEHISLPVQAGNDEILKRMRRGYTAEQYRSLVEQIHLAIPDVSLSTDVIVGFPGEDERQFERTAELLNSLRFDTVHIAAYSPRPGTIAWRDLADDVPPQEKESRRLRLEALQRNIAAEINAQLWGKRMEVLVEGNKNGKWQGRTRTNKLVFFADSANHLGQLVKVNITETSPWSLQGVIIR